MSPTTSSATPIEDKPTRKAESSAFPIRFDSANELMWLPYRTMFDLARRNHATAMEVLNIQRKFGDRLSDIIRSQQDLFLNLSGRFFNLLSGVGSETPAAELYGKPLDHLQDATLATMQEIGAAVAAAQASSFEALERQMHLDQPESADGHGHETAH